MEQVNSVSTARVEIFPTMNWGAIVAGWTIVMGIAVLLYLGGLALGLSSIHAHSTEGTAKAIAIGAVIWTVLTWAGALFVGGMVASWFDGKNDTMMGSMHGLGVWGLTLAIAVVLMVPGGHHERRGPMGGMHAAMMMEGGGRAGIDMAILHAQLAHAVRSDGGSASQAPAADPNAASASQAPADQNTASEASMQDPMHGGAHHGGNGEELRNVEMALIHDDTANATALLAAQTGLSDADAARIVQSVTPQVDKTRADAKQAASEAAHHAATVAAIAFLTTLISLLTALLGGSVGASHVHKIYHLRTYTRSTSLPPVG